MKDFIVTKGNIDILFDEISKELDSTSALVVTTQNPNTGKWGMAKLWRAWMQTTANWMTGNGATMPLCYDKDGKPYGERDFNKSDAHELFTVTWLLQDKDGERLSWSKKGRDGMRAATKGERFIAMQKHEQWCIERGIKIFIPRDSEYKQLETEGDR